MATCTLQLERSDEGKWEFRTGEEAIGSNDPFLKLLCCFPWSFGGLRVLPFVRLCFVVFVVVVFSIFFSTSLSWWLLLLWLVVVFCIHNHYFMIY